MKNNIIVIGGGIHGLTTAIALAESDANVTLLEKKQELFQGTSGSTHNRAHMGYHYPRSIETARECLMGLNFFKNRYPQVLFWPDEGYYIIEKNSRTTKEEYIKFCKLHGIPCEIKWPSQDVLSREHISAPFLSPEPIFNTKILPKLLEKEAVEKGVVIKKNAGVINSKRKNNKYILTTSEKSYLANVVINTTYAYTNNILKIFKLEDYMTKYRLQTTEVAVVKSYLDIPPLTIMDGPFMSIMPFAGYNNHYLIYDVENSIIEEKEGYFYDDSKKHSSNLEKMLEKGKKYFPFIDNLEFVKSLWGSRPIPVDSDIQSRRTRLQKYTSSPGFYSLLEGKFISALLMAQEIKNMLREDGYI